MGEGGGRREWGVGGGARKDAIKFRCKGLSFKFAPAIGSEKKR